MQTVNLLYVLTESMIKYSKLLSLVSFLMILAACSPKVTTTANKKPVVVPKNEAKPSISEKKFTEANISLLIPFKLNQLKLATATKQQVANADMAIDFYQGVKLGVDSASSMGLNFNLNVFDTRDDNGQLSAILKKENFRTSNLVIGPVFPENIKYISSYALANGLTIVSPLAASKPSEFNNPNLISVVNNIEQHSERIADYIGKHYSSSSSIVVLINPKKSADEQFAAPIRSYLKIKYPGLIVQEFTSAYAFETRMIVEKKYAVVVCSSDLTFVKPTLDKLFKLKILKTGGYELNVFGHPNWAKQNYNVDQLQGLNAIISASYNVDYKSIAVINFVKKYRKEFDYEPGEYAFKGFDIGFYFAKLLAEHGANYLNYLPKEKYKGLHNSFAFEFDPKYGYFNTDLMLLQYKNLALTSIN